MIKMNWYEEVKQDFIKNISDSYTLNLAMSVLEDRKTSLDENLKLQNNWNELKKWLEECLNELKQNDVYDRTSYETGQVIATECIIEKMQELGGNNE